MHCKQGKIHEPLSVRTARSMPDSGPPIGAATQPEDRLTLMALSYNLQYRNIRSYEYTNNNGGVFQEPLV